MRSFYAITLASLAVWPSAALAQDASLFKQETGEAAPLTLEHSSFLFRKLPPEAEQRELLIRKDRAARELRGKGAAPWGVLRTRK